MKAFLCSLLAIVAISVGAYFALNSFDTSVASTFSDHSTVRLDPSEEARTVEEE